MAEHHLLADAGLYAPEFQIVTAVTAITSANALYGQVRGVMNNDDNDALEVRLDLHDEIEDVSTAALTETVEDVLLQIDVEARAVLAAMDRAWPDESAGLLFVEPREQSIASQDVSD